ncbi:sigma-54 dependent transcriptional regulator [Uliginosibacterium sp. 31-16]|uniref:sigma-54-dependent transcriptional regulator n=1 Tax=Uliginosibacterium sp. 31-16 TaxID=3068315 RepID=UPI00273CF7E9|nr:sigma-54 dependent transcriptional regulator [Uliginosibacterium sp. 31-16]MDP5237905.1 sigma-54 dependent transcriptional regulator [Uliginosibacterium sp. 31-16]
MTTASRPSLLIVDDDLLIQSTLAYLLGQDFELLIAGNRPQALALLQQHPRPPDLALLDLGLPPHVNRADEGLALISELLAIDPLCKIIVLSGQDEEAHARHARTLGALEFLAKPAPPEQLRAALNRALELRRQESSEHAAGAALPRILGNSPPIQAAREQLQHYAATRFPVLIEGESGTGKEIAARALHELGPGKDKPFVALNCAAIAAGLIEATLFGHARGAFTGAVGAQAGYFEEAGEGSLFLDEIGELPLELQPKLLRVLESGEYQRVGETLTRQTRARVIAATNRDLRFDARSGRFRPDLFHRLSVLRVLMPPLRSLGNDRALLLEHFLADYARQMGVAPCSLDAGAQACWLAYDFPGNVRELRNIAVRLLSRHAGRKIGRESLEAELEADLLPDRPCDSLSATSTAPEPDLAARLHASGGIVLDETLRRVERDYIAAALRAARGNMAQAARLLGLNRSTLYNRIDTLARFGEAILPPDSPSE